MKMNRSIALFLVLVLILSLCACSSTGEHGATAAPTTSDAAPSVEQGSEVETEAGGGVEVDENLLSVEITIPADLVGETTQADLDAAVSNGDVLSAELNDDGSVTYKLTKAQHRQMMEGIKASIEDGMDELVASADNSFTKIETNDDFTEFKVTMTSNELNLVESFSVLAFYMYGGMYNSFAGNDVDNISVVFINESTGDVISSANSSEAGQ